MTPHTLDTRGISLQQRECKPNGSGGRGKGEGKERGVHQIEQMGNNGPQHIDDAEIRGKAGASRGERRKGGGRRMSGQQQLIACQGATSGEGGGGA